MERSTVVGVFRDRDMAERAIDELHRLGFRDDEIGFAVRGDDHVDSTTTTTDKAADTGTGALSGAIAGAGIGGLIAAAASLLIPGFGPVVAGGILATVLGGAAVGAAAGGILGALIGMGVPEEEARYYESEFQEGRILVTVKAGSRYNEARQALLRHGAYDVENREGMTTGMATTGTMPRTAATTNTDEGRMQLHEERLQPRTEAVQTGEVTLGKEVVTERKEMEVPVRREEVTIERHPVEGRPASGQIREGEEIRVPIHEERVEVDKQAVVYEEVGINKHQVQDTERVSEDVRREEARIERHGDVNVRGWDEVMPEFRQSWQSRYGSQSGRWEDFEPAYRYGYETSHDPRFSGRQWPEIEPDLRRDYGTWAQRSGYRHDDNAWERLKNNVKESWENGTRRPAA
jgi:uncharacterized protein (TIGR02271 family)